MEFQPLGDGTRVIGYDSFAANGGRVEEAPEQLGGGVNVEGSRSRMLTGYGSQQTWRGDEAVYPGSPTSAALAVDPLLPEPNYSEEFPWNTFTDGFHGEQYRDRGFASEE